ncbi:hypothetical protein [Nocardiopsis sp. JB363]|uniref:hypothetical protein n=1 Tax=Nocardiopsis sp. JB363 TaxID=1434837 RepID=UPI000979E722|nr:hypothetical protein [Nocardiopsis sp. JB363]SIO87200.1 transcriptional regulator, SARP family [Nocardiopsis sp. JB363]
MGANASYGRLDPTTRALHQLLALAPGEEVTLAAAQALADRPYIEVRHSLYDLVEADMLTRTERGWKQTDLWRTHAFHIEDEHTPDTMAAMGRILTWYLRTATVASHALAPHYWHTPVRDGSADVAHYSPLQAMEWFTAEEGALVAALLTAQGLDQHRLVWQLHEAILPFLRSHRTHTLWHRTLSAAHHAAEVSQDPVGQAVAQSSKALLEGQLGPTDHAAAAFEEALTLWEQTEHTGGLAQTLIDYAALQVRRGHTRHARHLLERSLALTSEQSCLATRLSARAQVWLGQAALDENHLDEARTWFTTALEGTGFVAQAYALLGLTRTHLVAGDPIRAAHALQRADLLLIAYPDRAPHAAVEVLRAQLHADDPARCRTHLLRAHTLLASLGHPDADTLLQYMASLPIEPTDRPW